MKDFKYVSDTEDSFKVDENPMETVCETFPSTPLAYLNFNNQKDTNEQLDLGVKHLKTLKHFEL